jgi:hypothetical protein
MELAKSNYIENSKLFNGTEIYDIFLYPSYSLDLSEYELLTNRWDNNEAILQNLTQKLESNEIEWDKVYLEVPSSERLKYLKATRTYIKREFNSSYMTSVYLDSSFINTEIIEYKDLRGLLIKDFKFKRNGKNLFDFAIFDYCIFENCKFNGMVFIGAQFNHVWFVDSEFINCYITSTIQNSIFVGCNFKNTTFQQIKDTSFSENLFFICEPEIALFNINPQEFAFIDCKKIKLLNRDYTTVGFEKPGDKVLKIFRSNLSTVKYRIIKKTLLSGKKKSYKGNRTEVRLL